jgi:hypothetical protein
LFTDRESGVTSAAAGVEAALRGAGFGADRQDKTAGLGDIFYGMGEGLAEWIVTAPGGRQMALQLAYFERANSPVVMEFGPVLDLEDALAGKVAALASRAYERDYSDVAAALDHYSVSELIGFAKRLDPGLADEDFADAGRASTSSATVGSRPPESARKMSPGCGIASRAGRARRRTGTRTLEQPWIPG